jgi:hypothetical protein
MGLSEELHREIENGRNGKSGIIPVPYERIGSYIDIAKNTTYVVGGETGAAKSTFVQDMFMIRPIQWYLKNKTNDVKLSVILFGMERKMYQYSARWLSRLIFTEQGVPIPPKKVLSRKKDFAMSDNEYGLVQAHYSILDEWETDDLLIAHEGSKNPSGISLYLEAFARKHGTVVDKDKTDKSMENILASRKYIPNHPNHIVLVIVDHIGILAPEKDLEKSKSQIDKFSSVMRQARDIYGFSPVIVQQLNRSMSDVGRQKLGDLAPKLSDFADSSQTQHDADVVMALFEPYRHIGGDLDGHTENGYKLKGFKDDYFRTYYRSLHILKNSFDASGMQFPMALHPEYGILKTLPRKNDITEDIYQKVTSGMYFLD